MPMPGAGGSGQISAGVVVVVQNDRCSARRQSLGRGGWWEVRSSRAARWRLCVPRSWSNLPRGTDGLAGGAWRYERAAVRTGA